MAAKVVKGSGKTPVDLVVDGSAGGYGPASIKASIRLSMTIEAARALAADLEKFAGIAEDKAKAKAAHEERRQKWRDREVVAGRMKIMTAREFFR